MPRNALVACDVRARTTTIDTPEAARRLGLKESTLETWRWRGDGPPYLKIGGAVRYREIDLADWLDSQLRSSTSDPGIDQNEAEEPARAGCPAAKAKGRGQEALHPPRARPRSEDG